MIVGIDTGATGAIAFMSEDGILLDVRDMPVDKVTVGKHSRSRVSRIRAVEMFRGIQGGRAFIERPNARPMRGKDPKTGQTVLRSPGAAGMLSFGESFGTIATACVAGGLSLEEVEPGIWKKAIRVPADKDEARRIAAEVFPHLGGMFDRKKDDGRAEAALIALWGYRTTRKGGILI